MSSSNLRKFLTYLKPYQSSLYIVIIAVIFIASGILGLGHALKYLIDEGFKANSYLLLNQALFLLLSIVGALTFAIYYRSSIIHSICEKMMHNIRTELYAKSLTLDIPYFEINKTSDIITKITNDTALLSGIIINIFSFAARNFLMLTGSIILLIITSPILSLYICIIIPFVTLPILIFGKKVRILSKLSQEKSSLLAAEVQENLNNIKIIQSYNLESTKLEKFNQVSEQTLQVSLKRIQARSLLVSIVISLIFTAIAFILWLGGKNVIQGNMTSGELSAFIFYSIIAASSFGSIAEIIADFQRALGAVDRIFELFNANSLLNTKSSNVLLGEETPIFIKFQNVNFSYPSRPQTLISENLNFQILPNEKVAIVGPSGAGKTTIFQLLLRFYDIHSGSITINDIPIQSINIENLRNILCYVPQEPVVFSANAYENIAFSIHKFSKEQIYEAAKIANIYDYLANLPEGFESFLGERGIRLSGGERQRIALARAAIRNPRILLLDEATSSLDTYNEKLIQNSLEKLMNNKTTIIIAHRMSTIINATKIIVMDKGKIENIGNHRTLLASSPLYNKLINQIQN